MGLALLQSIPSRVVVSGYLLVAATLLTLTACSDAPEKQSIGNNGKSADVTTGPRDPASGSPDSQEGSPALTGPTPLRRLTSLEYRNSVSDIVGDISALGIKFDQETASHLYPFTNRALDQLSPRTVPFQYLTAAETIAAATLKDSARKAKVFVCIPTDAASEDPCAKTIVTNLLTKAFRRPASGEQIATTMKVFDAGRKAADFATGIEWAMISVLQAPNFLYKLEYGSEKVEGPVVKSDPYDLASRLSYFLWNKPPDEALYAAAAANKLQSASEIESQVDRMLASPNARKMMTHFHDQWLNLENIATMAKESSKFPSYSPEVAVAMREEVRHFIDEAVWRGDGKLRSILAGRYTFLNKTLGDFYGIKGLSDSFEKIEANKLGVRQAAGLLTMGALLAKNSSSADTSPTLRGAFIRTALLCQELPPPPDNLTIELPPSKPDQTRRQQIDTMMGVAACAGCHKLMDPLGLAFENFNAAGIYRTEDAGKKIEVSGELIGAEVPGKFSGPVELAEKLAESDVVAECVATHWFQFAFARDPASSDKATIDDLSKILKSQGYLPAIKYMTQTPQFLNRTVSGGSEP